MSAQAQDRVEDRPPLSIEELTRGFWPFRPSLGRIALEIAVNHDNTCVQNRAVDKAEHAETRNAILAVGEKVETLTTALKPLTDMEPSLRGVTKVYLRGQVAWWGVAKVFGVIASGVIGVAALAEAWPMIRWTVSGVAGALLRHLSS